MNPLQKFTKAFFSMLSTVILLSIFAISIAYATFAENNISTEYAKEIVYNARWFEVLFVLLIVNLIGSVIQYNIVNKKKLSVLLFHLSFIFMLLGAGITRYIGSEGILHLREGETSNEIRSDKKAIKITAELKGEKVEKSTVVNFDAASSNVYYETINIGGKAITVENQLFVPNAQESIVPDENGEPAVSIFVMSGTSESTYVTLLGDEKSYAGDFSFSFSEKEGPADVLFSVSNNLLYFKTKLNATKTGTEASGMIDRKNAISIEPGTLCLAEQNTVFRVDKLVFMIQGFIPKASKMLVPISNEMTNENIENSGIDALIVKVSDNNSTKKINVTSSDDNIPSTCNINGVKVSISYGPYMEKIPFYITLRAFELERYAGSMSPSSFASEITVTDNERKSVRPFRIYMNNILNYRGYRFFQSSYDQDEMGTVLSVNKDFLGTQITYFGYLLMLVGMVLTLFNKNSRFRTVMNLTSQLQQNRKKSKIIILGALVVASSFVTVTSQTVSKEEHLKALNSLLIQDAAQGRIEPFNTFASDLLRKIYKHNSYKNISATEVMLGMSVNPDEWRNEPIIKVSNPQLEKELGAVNGYISYNSAFDFNKNNAYKLQAIVEQTYQKEESARNKYEKEVLNVDERINICSEIYLHSMLNIFPIQGNENGKWTIAETNEMNSHSASCPHHPDIDNNNIGMSEAMEENPEMMDMMKNSDKSNSENPHSGICTRDHSTLNNSQPTETLLLNYFEAVYTSMQTGNWQQASDKLDLIKKYQQNNGGENLPSASRVQLEIKYNDWNIFLNLTFLYAILGSILLFMHFVFIFKPTASLEKVLNFAIFPLSLLFAVFTAGMGLRWYISGHAPWSNGYESMIFVAWASSLAGLLFARKSPLAFSITALLSAIGLSVAAMSWMNPEITNLVPVLKSYWLIVHVAVITSSYGFLAMASILGLLNLVIMIFKTQKNKVQLQSHIQEISYIIEMALTIGLFLLTIGTFLGGIWANESWGRYWGWDAKETWALVSILVYSIILHLRLIPKSNNPLVLSSLALIGFSTVIMTFLGVNYYLSGMHSYGKGTPPPLPSSLILVLVVIIIVILLAVFNENKFKKKSNL